MELTLPSCEHKPSLEQVRTQFEQWRCSRSKRRAIPESLWEAAASLYPEYSLHRISKTLRLNHSALKHYVQRPSSDLSTAAGQTFIELGLATGADRPCDIEMRHHDGSRMSVRQADAENLMKLARLFWSRT